MTKDLFETIKESAFIDAATFAMQHYIPIGSAVAGAAAGALKVSSMVDAHKIRKGTEELNHHLNLHADHSAIASRTDDASIASHHTAKAAEHHEAAESAFNKVKALEPGSSFPKTFDEYKSKPVKESMDDAEQHADVNHNLRMYYTHLQLSKAHELLAQHGDRSEYGKNAAKADHHMVLAGSHHKEARAIHRELNHNDHGTEETAKFTKLKNEARDHVGYKDN